MVMLLDAQSSWADHRKEAGRSVRGPWLPRSQSVWFEGLHFGSDARVNARLKVCLSEEKRLNRWSGTWRTMECRGATAWTAQGDQMNEILSCARYNMRIFLKKSRMFCVDFCGARLFASSRNNQCPSRHWPGFQQEVKGWVDVKQNIWPNIV